MNNMKKNIIILSLILVVGVLVGINYFNAKRTEEVSSTTKNIYTVTIGNGPIEFDLPKGYGVYASGGYEGGNEFRVSVGKMLRDGYFHEAVPTIYIRDFTHQFGDPREYKFYKPSEYVDVIATSTDNGGFLEPKIIKLFGNKAVKAVIDADGNPIIFGYLRADQLSEIFGRKEYSITINGGTYGSGKEFNQELFDLVVNSLRLKSNK